MRIFIIILGILVFESSFGQEAKKIAMKELREKLPMIETPSGLPEYLVRVTPLNLQDNQIVSSIHKKFELRHLKFLLYGKVFESRNYLAILGAAPSSMGTPIIIVFNNSGDQIDSLAIYSTHRRSIIDSTGEKDIVNFAYIYPNKIVTLDSTVYMNKKMVQGVLKVQPETKIFSGKERTFKISHQGKIKIIN